MFGESSFLQLEQSHSVVSGIPFAAANLMYRSVKAEFDSTLVYSLDVGFLLSLFSSKWILGKKL
jgi:hypothetical protein